MGDPASALMVAGTSYDLVCEIQACTEGWAEATGLWHCDSFRIAVSACATGVYTLYDYVFQEACDHVSILVPGPTAQMIPRPELTKDAYFLLRDLCAGIGGIAIGAAKCDIRTILHVDKSKLSVRTLRLNFDHVIEGDVHDRGTQRRIHTACTQHRSLLSAGIPCQSYSVQGLQGGLGDARGQVLFPILRIAWLTQSSGIVLECVSEIQDHPSTLAVLQEFAQHVGFQLHQVVLELGLQWASRRKRWWCVMLPPAPVLNLQPWPAATACTTIASELPVWPTWPLADEQALAWTDEEEYKYSDRRYGHDNRVLDLQAQAPTALHSWGVALRPCPCQCRASPISEHRLLQGGFRGIGIFSTAVSGMRFLHPHECGFLNTLPPDFRHLDEPRSALSLVGNLAAPLQASWVFSFVRRWAEEAFTGASSFSPDVCLESHKHHLLAQRDVLFAFCDNSPRPCLSLQIAGEAAQVHVPSEARVADLLQAERRWAPFACSLTFTAAGAQMPPNARLQALARKADCQVTCSTKQQAKPAFVDPICVYVRTDNGVVRHQCSPGTFAFELLPADPSPGRAFCLNVLTGQSLPVDTRLWLSSCLDARQLQLAPGTAASTVWQTLCALKPQCAGCQLLHPWTASAILDLVASGLSPTATDFPVGPPQTQLLVPFAYDDHWACLHFCLQAGRLFPVYFDGTPDRLFRPASILVEALAYLWKLPAEPLQQRCLIAPAAEDACALNMIQHALRILAPFDESGMLAADMLRSASLDGVVPDVLFGHGGLSPEQTTQLSELLLLRGVPDARLTERIQGAIAKIGAPALADALRHKHPWPALKSAASKPGALFRWVQPDELEAHIGTHVPNAKSKKQKQDRRKAANQPLQVDPLALQLAPNTFQATDGGPLCQLGFHEVVPQARGIAFCSAQEFHPFTCNHKPISVEALALITTSAIPQEACSGAPVTSIRFPAIYGPTEEAILLSGSLLQLGDESVQIMTEDIAELEVLETKVVKVSAYRDELQIPWADFHAAPVRRLLAAIPELNLCRDPRCKQDASCHRFHPAVEEQIESVVLDVWNRQFQRSEGGKTEASTAAVFSAHLRIPASALQSIQRAGCTGVYFEPRGATGGADPDFAVVWLPGQDLAVVRHAFQTTEKAVGLARLGKKYGIRVREKDEQSIFEYLRPMHPFVKVQVTARYRLFPLPFGMQRANVIALLKKWGWSARPLQPCRGDATGCAWEVGADSEPPAAALPLKEGNFVLVTKLKDVAPVPKPPPVYATRRTRQHILYDDGDSMPDADPWSNGRDPWSQSRPPVLAAPPGLPTQATSSKLEQVAADLKQDVQAFVRKELETSGSIAAPTDTAQRLQRLEVGLHEVQAQNQKFEGWFQTFGGQVTQQAAELKDLSQGLAQSRSEMQNTVSAAVSGLQQSMSAQISAQLSSQFEQIEALFNKKPRTE